MANRDFIDILREIRGSGQPGVPYTNGIWYELMMADINGNPGIYGDILAKYGVILENSDDVQVILTNLELLKSIAENMPGIIDITSNPVRAALLEVVSEPLRQSILDAEANADAAITSNTNAQLRAWEAQAEKLTANSWANESTGTFVKTYTSNDNGTFTAMATTEYSAKHYKEKAAAIVGGVDWEQISGTPTTIAGYGITDAYTKDETEDLLGTVNLTRADKYLAAQNVVNMLYTNGKLTKVRYNNDTDVDYEVLTYNVEGKLVNVAHYVASVLKGNTVLGYNLGKLVSAPFIAV